MSIPISRVSSPPDRRSPPTSQEIERAIFRALQKAILLIVALYVAYRFLRSATFLVLFFALVFLVAAVLNPVVAWLQRRGIPRPASAAALGLLVLGAAAATIWFAVPPLIAEVQEFVEDLPEIWENLRAQVAAFLAQRPRLAAQLDVPESEELWQRLQPYVSGVLGRLGEYTLSLITLAASLVLLVVLVVYSLASPQPLVAGLLGAVPERHRGRAQHILELILARMKAYALGSLLLATIVGGMTAAGLYFLGVPFVLVFAVIAGVGELLPNIGPILSAIPPMLVAFAIDPMLAVWVAVLFLVVQQVENNLIVPLVMSRTLDLHPLSVVFMLLLMGLLFGLLGAILAVPATIVIKTLYQELYLAREVRDPSELEERSEQVVADQGTEEAVEETQAAPASSERRSFNERASG